MVPTHCWEKILCQPFFTLGDPHPHSMRAVQSKPQSEADYLLMACDWQCFLRQQRQRPRKRRRKLLPNLLPNLREAPKLQQNLQPSLRQVHLPRQPPSLQRSPSPSPSPSPRGKNKWAPVHVHCPFTRSPAYPLPLFQEVPSCGLAHLLPPQPARIGPCNSASNGSNLTDIRALQPQPHWLWPIRFCDRYEPLS